jgi:hypothetical protein
MNDVFAVQFFSLENLLTLFKSGDIAGAYYLAPFVTWYVSISISDLHSSLRLDLLTLSFAVFRDWYIRTQMDTGAVPFIKFFTEKINLIRYMNMTIFLHQVVSTLSEIALNRFRSHPVENIFSLMGVAANGNHSWDRCKGAVTKASLMNKIMFVHQIKSCVRRDFSIAGVKVFQKTIGKTFKFMDSVIEESHASKEYPISSIIRSCASHRSVSLIGCMTWKT